MTEISMTKPDDWHCHLRSGGHLKRTVADTAREFARAIVMPNLADPITTVAAAMTYRASILAHTPKKSTFNPLMTLYLNETVTHEELIKAKASGFIYACKLYPAGATTHSSHGVSDLTTIYPLLETMQEQGLLLLIHGESINPTTDIFERETEFIEKQLRTILEKFPNLKIVLEHISTKHAAKFVANGPDNLAATITAHHLLLNRNDLLVGGCHPHYYCLPILKTHKDQQALIAAATSGNPKFFLGTDSAPHEKNKKESSCGCAGIYTAHAALEIYAEIFEKHDALDKLESFASINGANFYGLPINQKTITLCKKSWQVPKTLDFGNEQLIPLRAGETIKWKIKQ